eukprot:m.29721 g.29721  ORF g.29721 m.29721 type:complete len:63 (-) comp9198_c0_seq1:48-236(-)
MHPPKHSKTQHIIATKGGERCRDTSIKQLACTQTNPFLNAHDACFMARFTSLTWSRDTCWNR